LANLDIDNEFVKNDVVIDSTYNVDMDYNVDIYSDYDNIGYKGVGRWIWR
jgi:hypothetical protein